MNRSGRFLVIGGDGMIGRALSRRLESGGSGVFTTTRREKEVSANNLHLDLSGDLSGWKLPAVLRRANRANQLPTGVVFCAAITNQEKCRQDPVATARVNVAHTKQIAESLLEEFDHLIFLSTNLVFDGTKPLSKITERVNPQTEYGRQKSLVEQAFLEGEKKDRVSIIRLGKVFHPKMALLQNWVEKLRRDETIHPLSDLICAPVSAMYVTDALERLVQMPGNGIFQISGEHDVSYAEIAARLAFIMKVDPKLIQPKTAAELGLNLEHLPAHTTMDSSRVIKAFDMTPPPVWTTIDLVLTEVLAVGSV